MYYLNKLVGFIVSPIGIAIFGGLVALLCAKREHRRTAKWLGWFTFAWLWLWMTPIMTWVVGVPLEHEFLVDARVPMVESFPEADAIVLLGGGMGVETNLSSYAEMWSGADRVWQAARLYKAGKAKLVIATGDGARDSTLPLLNDFGVPSECVLFHDARNTEEEAKFVETVLATKNTKDAKILLVTSAWHMRRSVLMFKRYAPNLEIIPAATDYEALVRTGNGFSFKDLIPSPDYLAANTYCFKEYVGYWGYRLLRK